MSIMFVEPIIKQIHTLLAAGLGAKLDAIDTEKGDFALADIAVYFEAEKILIEQFPSIEIFPVDSPGEDYTAYSVRCDHRIAVRVHAAGDDEEVIFKSVWRYLRAITELLKTNDRLTQTVDLCRFDGHSYAPIDIYQGGTYIYAGTAFFIIDQEEQIQ